MAIRSVVGRGRGWVFNYVNSVISWMWLRSLWRKHHWLKYTQRPETSVATKVILSVEEYEEKARVHKAWRHLPPAQLTIVCYTVHSRNSIQEKEDREMGAY